ncbi:MAG: hypothetical protein CMH22_05930 [Methylophaga sp.]|nr:hypothetical protein [Methylophaga sp.]|tara:strand:+ start:69443 stop:69625 length:183 start_codon:yes stop_codon:yes gene_type:complete
MFNKLLELVKEDHIESAKQDGMYLFENLKHSEVMEYLEELTNTYKKCHQQALSDLRNFNK